MNLFMIFGFRPNPHHNNEFGDVNFKVQFMNREHRLVGIAKSKSKEENITVSSTPGREIIQQVVTMTHDTRADIIAVICPTRLHPQLEAELEHIARHMNKKIVLLQDEFMIKLLKKNEI